MANLQSPAWNAVLMAGFHQLWRKGELCDIHIKSREGAVIKGHGVVLSAASPFFHDLLLKVARPTTLDFSTMAQVTVMQVLDFIYTGSVSVTPEDVADLKDAASVLGLSILYTVANAYQEREEAEAAGTLVDARGGGGDASEDDTRTEEGRSGASTRVEKDTEVRQGQDRMSKETQASAGVAEDEDMTSSSTEQLTTGGKPSAKEVETTLSSPSASLLQDVQKAHATGLALDPSPSATTRSSPRVRRETPAKREFSESILKKRSKVRPPVFDIASSGTSATQPDGGEVVSTVKQEPQWQAEDGQEDYPREHGDEAYEDIPGHHPPGHVEVATAGGALRSAVMPSIAKIDPSASTWTQAAGRKMQEETTGKVLGDVTSLGKFNVNSTGDRAVNGTGLKSMATKDEAPNEKQSDLPIDGAGDHVYANSSTDDGNKHLSVAATPTAAAVLDLDLGGLQAFVGDNPDLMKKGIAYLEVSDGMGGVQYIQVSTDDYTGDLQEDDPDDVTAAAAPAEPAEPPPEGNMDTPVAEAAAPEDDVIDSAQSAETPVRHVIARDSSHKKSATAPKHVGEAFQCDLCGRSFTAADFLERHRFKTHKALCLVEPRRFRCPHCDYSTNYKALMDDHVRIHTGEKPFSCKYCARTFRTKGILNDHERRESGLKPFECDQCGKAFATRTGMGKHVKQVHLKLRTFLCTVESCGKTYSTADLLKRHTAYHTGEKSFKCSFCGKELYTSHQLKLHVHSRHVDDPNKRFPCDVCGKVYRIRESLILHKRARHDAQFMAQREVKRIENSSARERSRAQKKRAKEAEEEAEEGGSGTGTGASKKQGKRGRGKGRGKAKVKVEATEESESEDDTKSRGKTRKRKLKTDPKVTKTRKRGRPSKSSVVTELVTDGPDPEPEESVKEAGETSSDDDVSFGSVSWHSDDSNSNESKAKN